MKIKINDKMISFPPYISTTWDHVKSLRMEKDILGHEVLVIALHDDTSVRIPNLDEKILSTIFSAHLRSIEAKTEVKAMSAEKPFFFDMPMRLGFSALDGLGNILQHNPQQSHIPPLPQEILAKISGVAKAMGQEEIQLLPKPEPHCNCLHCQIARAMLGDATTEEEEIVTEEDLKFRLWDIVQTGDKLYVVKNPLDAQEHYNVFLGEPIGCTCGNKNCEHIRAVLNS